MSRQATRAFARSTSRVLVILTALAVVLGPVAAAPGAGPARDGRVLAPVGPAPIEEGLLAELESGTTDRFVVQFGARPKLGRANEIRDFRARGRFVLDALTETATAAQADALRLVRGTRGAHAQSYWLRNTLIVSGSARLAEQLARLPGVEEVRAERVFPLVEPVEQQAVVLEEGTAPEWGVAKIGADAVWAEGITGSGIVVANIDTGVEYDHPALVNQYRGNLGGGEFDHAYSWWDPTGVCGPVPCDNAGHGTHTMGTMVGGDGTGPFTPDIGVAPGARWIAAKGCEDLFCTEGSLLSAGQFILAPTDLAGANPDPSKRPDIVNNSWGGGPGDPFYLDVVEAWRAAGIVPVFSAGNAGPFCESAGSPGDYPASFTVGATDIDDVIADFSSRGPSSFDRPVTPDVTAPGVDVVSSVPGGGYASFSGTSMAAPHTAGTLALMLSAEAALVGDVTASTTALRDTAVDIVDSECGGDEDGDPNNTYGDGRIDAAAAVALVATGGTLAGVVTDSSTGDPIAGASISAFTAERTFTTTTDADGRYDLFLAAGTYAATAVAFGYASSLAESVEIVTDATTTQDFALEALPRHDVTGVVTAASDGAPIENATVQAIGTPVPPATTEADGSYVLTLPEGTYTLRASAGGCTDLAFAEVELFADAVVDFTVARKLDNFGHGCSPIPFDWVDADSQTALYGDEFAGRLRLPFEFPYYGETYSQVFISDNGYLNFLGPDQFNQFPSEIPSEGPPNAAIYALWQNLRVDAAGAIEYATIGSAPNRAFVIEYSEVSAGSSQRAFEIKLWENGDIDLVYDRGGTGINAGIGIENADGTDALQFSFLTDILANDSAFRFTEVPTGLVRGMVTDANDGLPIPGATVEALGSGRSTRTDVNGEYALRLLPGAYTLSIGAPGYTTHEEPISLAVDEILVVDAVLDAPVGSVDPTELSASVTLGESVDLPVTLSNTGTGPLEWTVRERPTGETPPELPTIEGAPRRVPAWERGTRPSGLPLAETTTIPSDLLDEIITDPVGDGGSVDLVAVRAGADDAEITMELVYASDAEAEAGVGFVFLDTDQDPSTGLPAEALAGLPSQDVGMEYFVDLFLAHEPDPIVFIVDAFSFEIVAVSEARVVGSTLGFDVPLAAIGDDGFVNTALVTGDFFQPTDWAPDEGHGTIEPFSDAPWIAASPEEGVVEPGGSTEVTVTLGGPDVAAGTYAGRLVFLTNDPRSGPLTVDLSLEVLLPDTFGGAGGTISEAHSGEPLPATLAIAAEVGGEPYPITATAGDDGTWSAFGPEGTWPVEISLDGHVAASGEVTFAAGVSTPGQDFTLHREQPHALIEGGPFTFVLTEGRTASDTITISNPGGHADLTFETGEVNLDDGPTLAAAAGRRSLPDGWNPNARSTDGIGGGVPTSGRVDVPGDVLAAWPAEGLDLPWGVGFTGDVWISDPLEGGDICGASGGCTTHAFAPDGTPGTVLEAPWAGDWHADMAYDRGRGWLWQLNVGGDNGIYGIDPADGSVEATITGDPWSGVSQRGLAYDGAGDVFYVGGWNEGAIYTVAGPSWPTPGETIATCFPADPNISGLAWNPAFSLLWMATNSETDTIYLVDPSTCETLQALDHPDPGFSGAGIELDTVGNLWTVSQNAGMAFLIESGLPTFSDAPWLSVTPETGTVPVDGGEELTVAVDSTGLEPGVYRAQLIVLTNDPDSSTVAIPVQLVVPAYQQGVNAGGGAHETADGTAYAADRAYAMGSFGYAGRSTTRGTRDAISGTDEDPLYRTMRQAMTAYRFDVPVPGVYRVDLAFAEIAATRAGARVFTVTIEGTPVLVNLDVYAEVGADAAYDRSFLVEVGDGRLDVEFSAQRGDMPFVSAILVTQRPDLAPD